MLELINEILDLSKIEAGMMDLHLEKLEISNITKGIDGIFNPLAKEKKITYSSTIDSIGEKPLYQIEFA